MERDRVEVLLRNSSGFAGRQNPVRSRSRSKRIPLTLERNPEIAEFNPLALWDLRYLRESDDADISIGCMGKCSVVKGRMARQGKISKIFS